MIWTDDDQKRALEDGWGLFDNDEHGLLVERFGDAERFKSDSAAQAYVMMRAAFRHILAGKAAYVLAERHAVLGLAFNQGRT